MVGKALQSGTRVILEEARALNKLAEHLGDAFCKAVETIANATGRVIVTGMGKSGHVSNKIAATLASTGTPAFFVHPSEASHGDLGMISNSDVILALSNSGETKELSDMLFFAKRHGIALVAITQNEKSTLGDMATITLSIPKVPEACPNGLAPTTSSSMMLSLGDALAVALLEGKSFSKEDFKALHPGGQLGARLKRINDIMHTGNEVPLVTAGTSMEEALIIMTNKRFGCVGIIDESHKLLGIITDGDLRRHMAPDILQQEVTTIMTPNPKTIQSTCLAEEALHAMSGSITSLFVLSDRQEPIGIIHIHDLLRIGVV